MVRADQNTAPSLTSTLVTHLSVYGLQDPTHDGGLTLRGTDCVEPKLVTDHPGPRAVVIVHSDVRPIRLTGVVSPKARPAKKNIPSVSAPKHHAAAHLNRETYSASVILHAKQTHERMSDSVTLQMDYSSRWLTLCVVGGVPERPP
jgi:hypothetical protein